MSLDFMMYRRKVDNAMKGLYGVTYETLITNAPSIDPDLSRMRQAMQDSMLPSDFATDLGRSLHLENLSHLPTDRQLDNRRVTYNMDMVALHELGCDEFSDWHLSTKGSIYRIDREGNILEMACAELEDRWSFNVGIIPYSASAFETHPFIVKGENRRIELNSKLPAFTTIAQGHDVYDTLKTTADRVAEINRRNPQKRPPVPEEGDEIDDDVEVGLELEEELLPTP